MSFMNARDQELLREELIAIRDRVDRALRVLDRGQPREIGEILNKVDRDADFL